MNHENWYFAGEHVLDDEYETITVTSEAKTGARREVNPRAFIATSLGIGQFC